MDDVVGAAFWRLNVLDEDELVVGAEDEDEDEDCCDGDVDRVEVDERL